MDKHTLTTEPTFDAQNNLYPTKRGLIAWFESRNAASQWMSTVGCFMGLVTKGRANTIEDNSGLKYLYGGASTGFNFGNILRNTVWTLCTITKYTLDGPKNRILQGYRNVMRDDSGSNGRYYSNQEFVYGHDEGYLSVKLNNRRRNDGWNLRNNTRMTKPEWIAICSTNGGEGLMQR